MTDRAAGTWTETATHLGPRRYERQHLVTRDHAVAVRIASIQHEAHVGLLDGTALRRDLLQKIEELGVVELAVAVVIEAFKDRVEVRLVLAVLPVAQHRRPDLVIGDGAILVPL